MIINSERSSNGDENIIPLLPPEIIEASRKKRLILFLGAGVSCAVGVKNWDTISSEMLNVYREKGKLNDIEFSKLQSENYYIRFESLRSKSEKLFSDLLQTSLDINDPLIIERFRILMKKLLKFDPVSIVTTNVDNLIQKSNMFDDNKFYYKNNCNPQKIHDFSIFCIHGNVTDNIFTLSEKAKYYQADNDFRFFLDNISGSFCVLFIGYSLNLNDIFERFYVNTTVMNNNEFYHHAIVPSDLQLREMELSMKYKIKLHKYLNNQDLNYKYFGETINSWISKLVPSTQIKTPKEPADVPRI